MHACLAQSMYHTGRALSLKNNDFSSSLFDLCYQNRSDHYKHHIESNNHISITVSFTTLSKRRRKIAKIIKYSLSNKNLSAVCSCSNMIIVFMSFSFTFQLKHSLVISRDGCFTLLFFKCAQIYK